MNRLKRTFNSFFNSGGQVWFVFKRWTKLCWLKMTSDNPLFLHCSYSSNMYPLFKNILTWLPKSQHTDLMRWLILIKLIFYTGQECLMISFNSDFITQARVYSSLTKIQSKVPFSMVSSPSISKELKNLPPPFPVWPLLHLSQTTKALLSK